jgi:poly(A) polymerase
VGAGQEPVDFAYALRKRKQWSDAEIWAAPLVTGNDLIAMGFPPGPKFKEVLTRVEDEQLEGRLVTRDEAMRFVETQFRQL